MGDEVATDAAPAAGEFVDRRRRGDGSNRRSLEEMVAEVVAAAAAAHEAADAAAEVASSTAASAESAASAAKLASETAQTAVAEARKASASAAVARDAASSVAQKAASLLSALELESMSAAIGSFGAAPLPMLAKGENAAPAAPGLPIMAAAPTTQHRISNVRELLATGLLEGERVMYRQKTRTSYKIMLEGRIKGVLYSCLCHDEAMSAAQFELHAKCKSNNPNDHIFCFGKSLYTIVSHLRTKAVEEQSSVLLKLKEESEGTKDPSNDK
ncbi:unnamed protein product [Urochloa decumbens]|uniref:Tify domain-containing protein n=1 Tax=Urochloa decumbens TaxID=240449 RepID=A0ABC8XFB4_9POAL